MKKLTKIVSLSLMIVSISSTSLWAAGPPQVSTTTERLGMHLYKDKDLSLLQNQSCQTCHHPLSGFADRSNFLHPFDRTVSIGSDGLSLGGRNAPSSAYAGFSPVRYSVEDGAGGKEYFGGMFWDGRMDGSTLGDPLAEQAQGPPLNPVEMAMADEQAVLDIIRQSSYYSLWTQVYGQMSGDIATDWNNFARAVAAYERSAEVTSFSSKYDIAREQFTDVENAGLALFNKHCASCHPTTIQEGLFIQPPAPVFTTFGYANIGIPVNEALADNPDSVYAPPDYGLGSVVDDPSQDGKFKIPTLRNIVLTAPYSHNGNFPTLLEMVSFINDNSQHQAEVAENVTTAVGNLGLSTDEVASLAAFLETLTDGY